MKKTTTIKTFKLALAIPAIPPTIIKNFEVEKKQAFNF